MMRAMSVVVLAATVGVPALARAQQQPANPRGVAVKAFRDRVDEYLKLRDKARTGLGKLKETSDPAEITQRERALGEAVRAARADAKQGDIFTPDVVPIFREAIRANFKQQAPKQRSTALASVPETPLKVNDTYPSSIPLATVPPTLLQQLPQLPDGLEYRFVANRLILRDVNANIVVDFIPDALPKPPARLP